MRGSESTYQTMKKKDVEIEDDDEHHLEIIKAVAQAWHGHSSSSSNSRPTNEFDAYKRNFKTRPSRFKLEASSVINTNSNTKSSATSKHWDFRQSLWDSYEIVTVSKRLEAGLVFDPSFSNSDGFKDIVGVGKKKKRSESKNSLRSLFGRTTSKRFDEASVPNED